MHIAYQDQERIVFGPAPLFERLLAGVAGFALLGGAIAATVGADPFRGGAVERLAWAALAATFGVLCLARVHPFRREVRGTPPSMSYVYRSWRIFERPLNPTAVVATAYKGKHWRFILLVRTPQGDHTVTAFLGGLSEDADLKRQEFLGKTCAVSALPVHHRTPAQAVGP